VLVEVVAVILIPPVEQGAQGEGEVNLIRYQVQHWAALVISPQHLHYKVIQVVVVLDPGLQIIMQAVGVVQELLVKMLIPRKAVTEVVGFYLV
jgi:hypothetical protein